MALESATFPNQLVATNPTGADPKGQGDDHIRLIKQVIKSTFPNLTGAVTMTQAQLNQLGAPDLFVAPGMILMWSGPLNALPTGWLLCNGVGTISTGLSVPDLRDKFPVGAGASLAVRTIGGSPTHTHSATLTITPTALTIAQLPPHGHGFRWMNTPTTEYRPGIGASELQSGYPNSVLSNISEDRILPTGSGAPHGHGGTVSLGAPVNHLPPFMALGFIIKS